MNCNVCNYERDWEPRDTCFNLDHWKHFGTMVARKLEQKDDERDLLDVAACIETMEKITEYNCSGCGRHYQIPTHIDHFECICGHTCRMRHVGGMNPMQSVIDAAMRHFGNKRLARLAWIAEVVGGQHCLDYDADRIRKVIREEMDRWTLEDDGWYSKGGY